MVPSGPSGLENIAPVAHKYMGETPFDVAPSNHCIKPWHIVYWAVYGTDVKMGNTAEETVASTSNTEAPVTSAVSVPLDDGVVLDAAQPAPQTDNAPVTSASVDPPQTGIEIDLPASSGNASGGQSLGDHTTIDDLLPFTNEPMLEEEPIDTIALS